MFVKQIMLASITGFLLVGCAQTPESPPPSSDAASVFERTSPSVVIVLRDFVGGNYSSQGSGVVIAPAQVVTNCHVVKGHKTIHVVYQNNPYPAQLKFSDPVHDLCQLQVADLSAPSVTLRSSRSLRVGESVYAVGAPRPLTNARILKNTYERFSDSAIALSQLQLSLSAGLISALHPADGESKHIQTTAVFAGGSSGGGLFDQQGRLVGITTSYNIDWREKIQDTQLFFALPADWIADIPERAAWIAKAGGQEDYIEWLQRASTLKHNKDWPALVAHCQKEIAINRRMIDPYLYLGVGLIELKQYEKAAEVLKAATEIDKNSMGAWNNLGFAYKALKQYDKAIEYYEKATRLDPKNATIWSNLGATYYALKKYEKAVEFLEKAVYLDSQDATTWNNLGSAYADLKQYDKAIEYYEKAIRLDPQNALAWNNLGVAYYSLGRKQDMARVYQTLLRLDRTVAEEFSKQYLSGAPIQQ